MRKYMPVIVLLALVFSLVTVASAADVNTTEEIVDNTEISHTSSIAEETIQETNDDSDALYIPTENGESDDEYGDDCATAIIQGNNNDSTVSFRRDATSTVTLNVTHNSSIIKQAKGSGTYFFHVLISKDGWIVGNGGLDDNETSYGVEENALEMISKNTITNTNFNNIVKLKQTSSKGHFVIKAPNGTYALYINYFGATYRESGVLQPGYCLVVPNDPAYFKKGKYQNISGNPYVIASSRLLVARNGYGVDRRDILTYSYSQNKTTANVKIYACNDDGRYVNKSTGKLVDGIRTNDKFFAASSIPSLDTWLLIDSVDFTVRKLNTTITSENITAHSPNVVLTGKVTDEDGNPVNAGFVSFLFDNRTLKDDAGNVIYVNVTNGKVSINHTIANFWKKTDHTYYVRYYGNSKYEANLGSIASVNEADVINLTSSHADITRFGTNLTITAYVNYKEDNTPIDSGLVLFKVNGKTIRNPDNSTYTIDIHNGTATFNLVLDERYSAKEYKVTVVYGNGAFREEYNTTVNIKKVPTDIYEPKVSVKDNVVSITGTFVDDNGKKIPYNSYVSVKIDGITIRDSLNNTRTFNITNSVIDFSFELVNQYKKGNHTVTLVVPELRETLSVRVNATMTIVKR